MVTNPPMEEFLDNEWFEEWTAGWSGLESREEFEEYERSKRRRMVEEQTVRPASTEYGIAHAPTVQGADVETALSGQGS